MQKNKTTILFICPYPIGESPSQRFRFEQYFNVLQVNDFSFSIHPFLGPATWKILYQQGNYWRKSLGVVKGFIHRIILVPSIRHSDFVFIHREATPLGPPWFEWLAAKVFDKKIIYDFDDAIWLPNTSEENKLASTIKWHRKVSAICKWSYAVSCGNNYLCNYAKQFNNQVYLNPTTIDTENLHNPNRYPHTKKSNLLTIGWTGTHSTLKYLDSLLPIIKSLEKKFPFQLEFLVIADKRPSFQLSCLRFVPWSKETEIEDLQQFDIGLMPLVDNVWAKGKCGFKALQYMALGIPTIASSVGVNELIIENGINGYLCRAPEDWLEKLTTLIISNELRLKIGAMGKERVNKNYSVVSNNLNFLSLFMIKN